MNSTSKHHKRTSPSTSVDIMNININTITKNGDNILSIDRLHCLQWKTGCFSLKKQQPVWSSSCQAFQQMLTLSMLRPVQHRQPTQQLKMKGCPTQSRISPVVYNQHHDKSETNFHLIFSRRSLCFFLIIAVFTLSLIHISEPTRLA